MRKEEMIRPTLEVLGKIEYVRELTITQIFCSMQNKKKNDLFYMEDDEFCRYAKELFCIKDEGKYDWTPALDTLNAAWHLVPDWRLSQLLCNVQTKDFDALSDENFAELLKSYFNIKEEE